jgi:hypothetical protein
MKTDTNIRIPDLRASLNGEVIGADAPFLRDDSRRP